MMKVRVVATWLASVTRTAMIRPSVLRRGVPLITPVEPARFNPSGSLPRAIDQANGAVPPSATSVVAYAVPTVPMGSDAVVMVGLALPATTSVNVAEAVACQ